VLAQKALPGNKDRKVQQDHKENKELQGPQESKVQKEPQVLALRRNSL
jgi:hypothetical protein